MRITTNNYTKVDNSTYTSKVKNDEKDEVVKNSDEDLSKDTFVKSDESDTNITYTRAKKLTSDEVDALKEEQANQKSEFIRNFVNDTIKNQANLFGASQTTKDLLTEIFGSTEKALPTIKTDPIEAQKAISEGGDYSVDAVATRIMKMAEGLAGGDTSKIAVLRNAVEKGFSAAGLDFEDATKSKLPQICQDTYKEVMKRFDEWENKSNKADQIEVKQNL
jgi:hypothetical protein